MSDYECKVVEGMQVRMARHPGRRTDGPAGVTTVREPTLLFNKATLSTLATKGVTFDDPSPSDLASPVLRSKCHTPAKSLLVIDKENRLTELDPSIVFAMLGGHWPDRDTERWGRVDVFKLKGQFLIGYIHLRRGDGPPVHVPADVPPLLFHLAVTTDLMKNLDDLFRVGQRDYAAKPGGVCS